MSFARQRKQCRPRAFKCGDLSIHPNVPLGRSLHDHGPRMALKVNARRYTDNTLRPCMADGEQQLTPSQVRRLHAYLDRWLRYYG